jgi:hypothetical protein
MGSRIHEEARTCTLALSATEKAVYRSMASLADDVTRQAWPSRETLAKDTGLSVTTIKKAWRDLESAGLIRPEPLENEPFEGMKTIVWYLEHLVDGTPVGRSVPDASLPPESQAVSEAVASRPPVDPLDAVGSRPPGSHTVSETVVSRPLSSTSYGGTSSSSLRSEQTSSLRSEGRPRILRAVPAPKPLAPVKYFQVVLNRAMDEYGATVTGAISPKPLQGAVKILRKAGLDDDYIRGLMDTYGRRPDKWWPTIHPSRDFARKDTLTWVRALYDAGLEYSSPAGVSREAIPDAPEVEQTYEEAMAEYKRKQEAKAPSWAKRA